MKNFIQEAIRTESPTTPELTERISNHSNIRLLHAGMGLTTEAGEFVDQLKKHIFYGKPLDKVNLKEEIADGLWYCAIALDEMGYSFEEVMEMVIDKLRARYPDKFTQENALNRDLDKERSILENKDVSIS